MEWPPWSRVDDRGLARYVTPKASRWMELDVNRFDLKGQKDERRRLVQAIYDALTRQGVRYAHEQYHPSLSEQIIRPPNEVLNAPREGTCLDLASVFCGLCLSFDLLPFLIVIDGHAIAAVSLLNDLGDWDGYRPERPLFDRGPVTDATEFRTRVDAGALLALECTGFAHSEAMGMAGPDGPPETIGRLAGYLPFERALAAGREQLDYKSRPFQFAIDIAVAHHAWGIQPFTTREVVRTWTQLRRDSHEQASRFLRETQGTPERRGPFIREVQVPRPAVEAQLQAFLGSPAVALAILGDAGVGKTSLVCRWVEKLQEGEHITLVYDCATLADPDIEALLARDLSVEPAGVEEALAEIGRLGRGKDRQFVIIFDAINEFRDSVQLLRRIDNLVRRIPGTHVRVALTCTGVTWRHFERLGTATLARTRYFAPAGGESGILVERYAPAECEAAYQRYRDVFQLQTAFERLPRALREQLRDPLVMRLLAETYRGRAEPIAHSVVVQGILRRYFDERVTRVKDQLLVDALAVEMLGQRRPAVPVLTLARRDDVGREVMEEQGESSYRRLLDAGIVVEVSGTLAHERLVKFAHLEVGAYALALHLLRQNATPDAAPDAALLAKLVREAPVFPLGWSVARMLVLLAEDASLVTSLAQSADVELRELSVETLVALNVAKPELALRWIAALLELKSAEARRTALKAAHRIGTAARPVFLSAARSRSRVVQRAAKDTLYLLWRNEPKFTHDLLDELAGGVRWSAPLELTRVLRFMLDLSVTMYVNHCERIEVGERTADLWYQVFRGRLHLPLRRLPAPVEKALIFIADRGLARPMLEAMLLGDVQRAFHLTEDERRSVRRVVPLLDPSLDLRPAADDLEALLRSDAKVLKLLAGLALAIHSYHNFDRVETLSRELFARLDRHGRLWQLLGYSVLLPESPAGWVEMLEGFTEMLFDSDPDLLFGSDPLRVTGDLDVGLLPLGLAYAKRGNGMPLLERFIKDGLARGGSTWSKRCISALGPLGFYYPEVVFGSLRRAVPDFGDATIHDGVVDCLATVRTLHQDAVDVFLQQIGADETVQRRIAARTDVERVQRYIYGIGLYNNAVHQAIHYPRMRRRLLMHGFSALVDSTGPDEYVARFVSEVLAMTLESKYQLREWTLPE